MRASGVVELEYSVGISLKSNLEGKISFWRCKNEVCEIDSFCNSS